MDKPEILVVEDEPAIRNGLCDVLAYHGWQPTGVEDGGDGLRLALSGRYRLVMLDVMLPTMDGFTICKRVRAELPKQPILILTARGAESDVLDGFSSGADDYVSKPFSVPQLVARVQALLRRAVPAARTERLGGLDVDPAALTVRSGDTEVEISPRDADVLVYFAEHRGRVVSREDLLRDVWGYPRPDALETRCVDMHIAKLRKKLAPVLPGGPESLIETVRGAGYRVRP